MDLDGKYQEVLQEIEKGHRALVRFGPHELEFLVRHFEKALEERNEKDLEKVLCLIEHSASLHPPFEPLLLKCLNMNLPENLTIFCLTCARKHVLLSRQQRGLRLQYDFLEALKRLLYSRSPEVVEWTLRTIEECGNQGVYFLKEFDKIKPPPWKWFNQHQRAVREIIAMLERRWGQFEKS